MSSDDGLIGVIDSGIRLESELLGIYRKYYPQFKDEYLRLMVQEMMLTGETQIRIASEIIKQVKDNPGRFDQGGADPKEPSDLPKELRDFKETDCIIVELEPEAYSDFVLKSVKQLTGELSFTCVYVSVTKPSSFMRDILGKAGVDTSRVRFIDCNSVPETRDTVHPSDLTQLTITLRAQMEGILGRKVVVFDTLSALRIYNRQEIIADFVGVLSKRGKMDKFGMVWLHIRSQTEPLSGVVQTFADRVVEYPLHGR